MADDATCPRCGLSSEQFERTRYCPNGCQRQFDVVEVHEFVVSCACGWSITIESRREVDVVAERHRCKP